MDPADSDGISRVPPYSGGALRQRGISRMGLSPAVAGLSRPSRYALCRVVGAPTTPAAPERRGFGLCPGRSPLLGVSLLFSLPAGTKMFQFPALAPRQFGGVYGIRPYGLTHSDTHGSRAACAYPWIFAACRVLLRLREPRHPPRALLQLPEASTPAAWGGHVSFRFDSFTRLSCLSLTCAEFVYRITLSNMP